tara:strand:- start:1625 stop:2716 length:1092 start_codon:yes stop_codon:yes gene_type:complete
MSDLAEITENNDDCLIVDKATIQLTSCIFDKFEPYKGVCRAGEAYNFIGALLPKFLTYKENGKKLSILQEEFLASHRNGGSCTEKNLFSDVGQPGIRETRRPSIEDGETFAEWYSIYRSIELAKDSFLMLSLGAFYGAPIVNTSKFINMYKPMEAHFVAVEAAENNCDLIKAYLSENSIDEKNVTLLEGIISENNKPRIFMNCEESSSLNRMLIDEEIDRVIEQIKINQITDQVVSALLLNETAISLPMPQAEANVQSFLLMKSAFTISDLVSPHKKVDFLEMDIQGGEYNALPPFMDILNKKVAWIHLGTHELGGTHKDIRNLFLENGWKIHIDWFPNSKYITPKGQFLTSDGVLAMQNLNL